MRKQTKGWKVMKVIKKNKWMIDDCLTNGFGLGQFWKSR
jgi:hypothetical protein